MKIKEKSRGRILKNTLLKLIQTERKLEFERKRNIEIIKLSSKTKGEDDLLKKVDIETEYGISQKTIDRMRARGLKTSQSSPKSTVWIVRKDFEEFLKKDRYDR
ncbi:hypothetical protein [Chishuiella sp.]|uniref:hypothetical protein n=1 Tax=Chishuiella sp. TaxID=1969467 RepID=UPI0028B05CE3|nr:hypothetical protein [Chishuiella sp.]